MIKTGFCVSYDWEFLRTSLPRVYKSSDSICLAVDINRLTWGLRPFAFDQDAFYSYVQALDVDKKVIVYEDEFAVKGSDKRENCNRHRTMIAEKLGPGGWHVQVDSDEYFLDFDGFVDYLKELNPNPTGKEKPFNVLANWIPLYKRLGSGYLYVDFQNKLPEMAPFASTRPNYERARHNGFFNRISPFYVVHETWARSEEDLWFKINNWGHASEELKDPNFREQYFEQWKETNETNYAEFKNIHPANAGEWPALSYGEGRSIEDFLANLSPPVFPLNKRKIRWRNNRNIARVKHFFRRFS